MLFIEYGDIKVLTANGVTRNEVGLSVSVACELNEANNDMLNEAMKMQRGLELMQLILTDMQEESKNCGVLEFVTSPVQVMPGPVIVFRIMVVGRLHLFVNRL